MTRTAQVDRKTHETQIHATLDLDGKGKNRISTGIGFFNHMLTLFSVHGLFDLELEAIGDLDVDYHHTVEDVGLVLGDAISKALGKREGIRRYGHAAIPMDDSLAEVTLDLSNRPYLVYRHPEKMPLQSDWDSSLAREFFKAVAQTAGMNLHIHLAYGENWHHMVEAAFKGFGRALRTAVAIDARMPGLPTSKGSF
jgi:imidazoleglycerol-phosphate dehydratase